MEKVLVTGGMGFIGRHLVERLRKENEVIVLDRRGGDIKKDLMHISEKDLEGVRKVYHLAADADVKSSAEELFDGNILSTFVLLQRMKECNVKEIIFTSSSTVYGEPPVIPTPESYGPLKPISFYGASKLSCEAMISSFCSSYGMEASIFRLANVIGEGCHGVIKDFIEKLRKDPKALEILGDGKQKKSYLYIDDAIDGILSGHAGRESRVEIYNLGSDDWTEVTEIARIVAEAMKIKPELIFKSEL
ncbi:MAG: NAD-dependent epimerase/dehydratase family protein, partial [Candidatus Thermoplasmatota archaeon]|nr:NAD-dependent epimerase/dehydratase family protein [Candidatus Thermoplasmatota archaeon]